MLREDVLDGRQQRKISHLARGGIEEGIELLTGHAAGHRNGDGSFEDRPSSANVDPA